MKNSCPGVPNLLLVASIMVLYTPSPEGKVFDTCFQKIKCMILQISARTRLGAATESCNGYRNAGGPWYGKVPLQECGPMEAGEQ